MRRYTSSKLTLLTQIVLGLCLMGLAAHLFADNLEGNTIWGNPEYGSENQCAPYALEVHHHEEEFILPVPSYADAPITATVEAGNAAIPTRSYTPAPLLPPPKSSNI